MYHMYFGEVQFMLPPAEFEMNIGNNNETIKLMSGQEINILKSPKLTEISFEVLLPNQKYAFIESALFFDSAYYLQLLERLKTEKKSFKFKLIRTEENELLDDINMQVSLEEYSIKETNEDNGDITVSISLKKYVKPVVKKLKLKNKNVVKYANVRTWKKNVRSYKTKKGDTLYLITKKCYNTTEKAIQKKLYNYNKKVIDKNSKGGKWDKRTLPAGITLKIPVMTVIQQETEAGGLNWVT